MIHLAIITKSASTRSGARIPFELSGYFSKYFRVTIFADSKGKEKGLGEKLKSQNIKLVYYQNPFDLYRKLKNDRYDLISFHSTLLEIVAAKLTFIPVIKTYYGTQFDAYLERYLPNQKVSIFDKAINYSANLLIWLNQKLQLLLSDRVVAISKYTQKELEKLYATSADMIYIGINLKMNIYYSKPKLLTIKKNQSIKILTVSRLTPYKGFHILLETINKLRQSEGMKIKVIIVGSSNNKHYLNYLNNIKDRDDQILTDVNDKKLFRLYQDCDIYVSCDKYLFFGLPVAEAAVFGKPTIALDFAAAKELVSHGKSGFVASSKEDFCKYLKMLIQNPNLRAKLGREAAFITSKKFNLKTQAGKYIEYFNKLPLR